MTAVLYNPIATKLGNYIPLVIISTWLNVGGFLAKALIFAYFFVKFPNRFSRRTIYLPYLRNDWSNWCETRRMLRWLEYLWPWPLTSTFDLKFPRSNCILGMGAPIVMEGNGRESIGCPDMKHRGNESAERCADWGTFDFDFDLEFSRSNCISGMGGPIVMEWKESIRCPDVKHNHYVTSRQRLLLGTGVTYDVGVSVVLSSFSWLEDTLHNNFIINLNALLYSAHIHFSEHHISVY